MESGRKGHGFDGDCALLEEDGAGWSDGDPIAVWGEPLILKVEQRPVELLAEGNGLEVDDVEGRAEGLAEGEIRVDGA